MNPVVDKVESRSRTRSSPAADHPTESAREIFSHPAADGYACEPWAAAAGSTRVVCAVDVQAARPRARTATNGAVRRNRIDMTQSAVIGVVLGIMGRRNELGKVGKALFRKATTQ